MSERSRPNEADLSMEALDYVLGDLEPRALDAFEARLATDQEARDAVADAVLIVEGMTERRGRASVEPSRISARGPTWLRWAAAAVLLASLSLVVVMGTRSDSDAEDGKMATRPSIERTENEAAPQAELIASWVAFNDWESFEEEEVADNVDDASLEGAPFEWSDFPEEEEVAAHWLLEALASESRGGGR